MPMKKDEELSPELRKVAREGGKRYCINSVCLELKRNDH